MPDVQVKRLVLERAVVHPQGQGDLHEKDQGKYGAAQPRTSRVDLISVRLFPAAGRWRDHLGQVHSAGGREHHRVRLGLHEFVRRGALLLPRPQTGHVLARRCRRTIRLHRH